MRSALQPEPTEQRGAGARGWGALAVMRWVALGLGAAVVWFAAAPGMDDLPLDARRHVALGVPRIGGVVGWRDALLAWGVVPVVLLLATALGGGGTGGGTGGGGGGGDDGRRARRAVDRLLAGHVAATGALALAAIAIECVLPLHPYQEEFLPFRGADRHPWANRAFVADARAIHRHRGDWRFRSAIDIGRHGDLVGRGLVAVPAEAASRVVRDELACDADGMPLAAGAAGAAAGADVGVDGAQGGGRRVVILGDSIAIGYGMPRATTWPGRVAAGLAAEGATTRLVACGGWSPAEALAMWESIEQGRVDGAAGGGATSATSAAGAAGAAAEAARTSVSAPRRTTHLVVQFFEGNDLADLVALGRLRERGEGATDEFVRLRADLPWRVRALERTRAAWGALAAFTDLRVPRAWRGAPWTFVEQAEGLPEPWPRGVMASRATLRRLAARIVVEAPRLAPPMRVATGAAEGRDRALAFDPGHFFAAWGDDDAMREEGMTRAAQSFALLRALEAARDDVRVTIVYVPAGATAWRAALAGRRGIIGQVDRFLGRTTDAPPDAIVRAVERWRAGEEAVRWRVIAAARAAGLDVVDTTAALEAVAAAAIAEGGEGPFLPWDSHLDAAGHAAVAATVLAHLRGAVGEEPSGRAP